MAAVFCPAPAFAVKDENWVEPVIITPQNIGSYGMKNEEVWYKEIQNDIHVGYFYTKYSVTDKLITITTKGLEDIPYIHYKVNFDVVTVCEPYTLRPLKQTIKSRTKISNSIMNLYKDIYYDWKNKVITIVPGQEKGLPTRKVKIPDNAVPNEAASLFMREKRNLIVGTEYNFVVFDPLSEKFITASAKVLKKMSENTYDVFMGMPTAYGDLSDLHIFAGPKSDKHPNGIVYRQVYIVYYGNSMFKVALIKTDKATATKIEKKKDGK